MYSVDTSKSNQKQIVHYIGNAFPDNYADVDDDERGMMILEHGGEPVHRNWWNCPKYRTIKHLRLLDEKETILKSRCILKS